MTKILQKTDLESLPSNLFYHRLNSGWGNCESLDIWSSIKSDLVDTHGIQNDLENIMKSLCYVTKLKDGDTYYSESCYYLYYWLGNILFQKLHDQTLFSDIIGIIYSRLPSSNLNNKCNFNYSNITKNDFNKRKMMYDYSQNFPTIKSALSDYDQSCYKEYHKHINDTVAIYNELNEYCNGKDEDYCNEFKKIFLDYSNSELASLNCTLIQNISSPSEVLGSPRDQNQEEQQQQQQQAVESEGDSTGPRGYSTGPRGDSTGPREDSIGPRGDSAESPGEHTGQFSTDLPLPQVASSSGSHKAIATIIPILAILSIFFLLYKFTGLGQMARNLLRRKRINEIDSHEELTHKLLDSTYDSYSHTQLNETYIGYQAT
ncbi:PIR Superfamily Protein [Plasmodium ovale wallikeri]|uniref:PIR Superfamily Protein n=1 Tax=Plasmodium ovale wallikeri TaxID=864142 RepID=A0A1A9ANU1_PLAOA|nr:PIR Superfamily Protein [Plasmodium ovale wallikeri]